MRQNGWSDEEIQTLMRRTGRSRALVESFCLAVDKRLYLMLDDRQRRASLYFHLGMPDQDLEQTEPELERTRAVPPLPEPEDV